MSNSQLNKLKPGIKNGTELTLKVSSNFASDSNDESNFAHQLLLPETQVLKFRETVVKLITVGRVGHLW